jgi:hypothetical protein
MYINMSDLKKFKTDIVDENLEIIKSYGALLILLRK